MWITVTSNRNLRPLVSTNPCQSVDHQVVAVRDVRLLRIFLKTFDLFDRNLSTTNEEASPIF
jgi:hypothetical protein